MSPSSSSDGKSFSGVVAIVTLREHRTGIWIRKLVEALTSRGVASSMVQVLDIDGEHDVTSEAMLHFAVDTPPPYSVVVNRVSDTAPPTVAKVASAFFQLCESHGVRVVNGSRSFNAGINKILHHAALRSSGLRTPPTIILRSLSQLLAFDIAKHPTLRWPLLLKPNAGGFGRGQRKIADAAELKSIDRELLAEAFAADGVALLQNYYSFTHTYRVWTLGDRVQCAVRVEQGSPCMAEACSIRKSRIVAWQPSVSIEAACVKVMRSIGAECGSVEFLIEAKDLATELDKAKRLAAVEAKAAAATAADDVKMSPVAVKSDDEEVSISNAVFFDVNLVSTLPDHTKVIGSGEQWLSTDFYGQLADLILK